ncbi:UPF0481 protein At3g47200-like [Malania oleifera]|uniref:UPF0481 protein At3g47200-like n=1 Tax=Malania oleifera TaxID=397392 RepID=UPI0025AEC03B|nr:UPF0481 protein At3g47200-like [Malania oleifera]
MDDIEEVLSVEELYAKRQLVRKEAGDQASDKEVWVSSILESNEPESSKSSQKIRRVPQMLREQASIKKEFERFFEPRVVSIGPYHHGNPKLKVVEELKPKFARRFVSNIKNAARSENSNTQATDGEPDHGELRTSINKLSDKIRKEIEELRKGYADENSTSKYSDEDLARMLFLDGCFILQFIENRQEKNPVQPQMMKSHYEAFVEQDLFLLENQLPFRVLQILAEAAETEGSYGGKMKKIEDFINDNNMVAKPKSDEKNKWWETQLPAHLLELLRKILLNNNQHKSEPDGAAKKYEQNTQTKPNRAQEVNKKNTAANAAGYNHPRFNGKKSFVACIDKIGEKILPSQTESNRFSYRNVKELTAVGIEMKCSRTSNLTDISFDSPVFLSGQLKLPPITIDDSTGPKFMNLMAYEMCPDVTDDDLGVTSYVCFLDSLIDHADDVKELRKARVIHNLLGSDEEVAKLFNDIGTDLVPNSRTYREVMEKIERHYKSKVRSWIALFIDRHFSTPWSCMAALAAVYVLFLSSAQTYFQVFPPPGACDPICDYIIRRTHI